MNDSESSDPTTLLEDAIMSRAQIVAVGVTSALSALDGYDALAISFAAPGISATWGIGKPELGLVLSSGLAGMAFGSLALAPLADKLGRRRLVFINLTLMAVGMLASAFATTTLELAIWRVMTGIGIGSMVPVVVPYAAELGNRKHRGVSMAAMTIGYPLGGTIGGGVAAILLMHYAWPSVFLFGGTMAVLLMVVVFFFLPEPMAFLLAQRDDRSLARVNALLARFGHGPVDALPPLTARAKSAPYREIFVGDQRRPTLRMMAVNLLFLLTVSFFLTWLPQLVADAGHSASNATMISALMSFAGVIGCLLVGYYSAGRRIQPVVAALMIATGGATALFGYTPGALVLLATAAMTVGFLINCGVMMFYQLIVGTFEARFRATGVGFVMGVGRVASAASPILAGALFGWGLGRGEVSAIIGCSATTAGFILIWAEVGHRRQTQTAQL
jgi:MFS transporter, AAHS family, 4-hydroxybenzoate transporter